MSEEARPKFELPWGTLLPVLAALAGVVVQFKPLVSTRPVAPAEKPVPVIAPQDVDARLWQDPLAVAQKQKAALLADMSAGVVPKDRGQRHDIRTLRELLHERAATGLRKVLLLGVMIDAGPYSEQGESRLRARQAVLEGLSESGFIPKDGEHIGYVTSPWPLPSPDLADVVSSVANAGILLPWEECEALESRERVSPPGTTSVIVLWLPAVHFNPNPLTRFAGLIDTLAGDIRAQITVRLLGPTNSTDLQNMVREVRAPDWSSAPRSALDGVRIISSRATASDASLLYDPALPATGPGARATSVQQLLQQAVPPGDGGGLHFLRTVATDDVVLQELIKELWLRRVPVGPVPKGSNFKVPPGPLPHVVLLSEWDTAYGRSLGMSFAAQAFDRPVEEIMANRSRGKFRSREGQSRRQLHFYRYLRGIDGQLPGDPARDSAERSQKKSAEAATVEGTEGLDQADYLRRLARTLKEDDRNWRLTSGVGVRAFGLLGSDTYDKLMILRALRPEFPEAIFFTNTYDAHLERRDDLDDTHNLVIGSPFGNEVPTNFRRQRVAPFRDSNQTSLYAGTLVATERMTETVAQYFSWQPRIFEIGRDGAHELSDAWYLEGRDLTRTNKTWFRDWLYSGHVRWQLAGAAFVLALLVGWVSASNAHRSLPGGGTTPQRLLRVLSSTPFWVVCGSLVIVLCVAAFAQSGEAAQEPFAFFSGISIWPSEMLRLIALMLAIHFMIKASLDLRANAREIEQRYGLQPLPPSRFRGADLGLGFELWRLAPANRPGADEKFTAQQAWHAYLRRNKFRPRLIRIAILSALYFVFSALLFILFSKPVTPARGEVAFVFDWWVLLVSVVGLILLSFYVVDAIQLNSNFIRLFVREVTRWGHGVAEQCRRSPPLREEELSAYHEIFFVAQRTEVIARLIWYPLIVLTLMIVARFSFFDNWSWPPSLLVVFALTAAWALGSAVYLRRAAEQLRGAALNNLALLRLGAFTDEVRRKTFEELIEEIRRLKKGAFAPLSEQPFIRAVLFPSGGLGLIAVGQRLFELF